MDPETARKRFEERIASSGKPLASLTPQDGLELLLRSYGDDHEGDLTCSWQQVNRYGSEEVGFRLTRWLEYQSVSFWLSLLFKVGPRDVAGDFPDSTESCGDPDQVEAFRSAVEGSPSFKAWGRSPAAGVALICEDLETWSYALFDWWGVRDPSRPIIGMTEEEWLRSDDAPSMVRWFRQEWVGKEADLNRLLRRYFLACCRKIWRLLPRAESLEAIEVTERFVDDLELHDELKLAEWNAEGAALMFSQEYDPEAIARWCEDVSRIPPEELAAMIHSPRPGDDLTPRGLLEHAAYFAHLTICYPWIKPIESIERYRLFMSAPILREIVGNPFCLDPAGPPA